jgi:hypothetical protein
MLASFCSSHIPFYFLNGLHKLIFIVSEDERMQFQDKLNYMEQELAATKGRESALQERLLKELHDYQERFRDQVKKINELEVSILPWNIFWEIPKHYLHLLFLSLLCVLR